MKLPRAHLPPTPWGQMPPMLRVLLISPFEQTGEWLRAAFAEDQAVEIVLVTVPGLVDGLARLREESFDTVLVDHDPDVLDALAALDAIRTGSSAEQPVLVLGTLPDPAMVALCFESGADAYLYLPTTTTRTFLWQLARATERHRLVQENQRLHRFRTNCHQLEQEEAARLLRQHRELVGYSGGASGVDPGSYMGDSPGMSAADWAERYRELLQAYVIMGSGGMEEEIERWLELLLDAKWTARQLLALHLQAVEKMIQDLGCRSSRHMMNRAHLLATHLLLRYCEQSVATIAETYHLA